MTFCDEACGGVNTGKLSSKEPGPNATGLYRYDLKLPLDWLNTVSESRFFLVLEGVDSNVDVWLDGTHVGYSQDSCLPCEFEITHMFRENETTADRHLLALRVMRWCDGSYLEDQDKWWLSGVYREIYIIKKGKVMIQDYSTESSVSWNDRNEPISANISTNVAIEFPSNETFSSSKSNLFIRVEVYEELSEAAVFSGIENLAHDGSFKNLDLANASAKVVEDQLIEEYSYGCFSINAFIDIAHLHLWSPDQPFLYFLLISLHNSRGDAELKRNPIDCASHRFGVREVRIGGPHNQLQLNRRPLIIAGVNRCEFNCNSGRSLSRVSASYHLVFTKELPNNIFCFTCRKPCERTQ